MANQTRQYGSAKQFYDRLSVSPANAVSDFDKARLSTYALCEDLYDNYNESFKIIIRGEDEDSTEIFVPEARKVIDAKSRFMGVGFTYDIQSADGKSVTNDTLKKFLDALWKRESIGAKYQRQKIARMTTGDSFWYIVADEDKDPGERISINELDPSTYFPIFDSQDLLKVVGCNIVEEWPKPGGKPGEVCARRQKYVRVQGDDGKFTGEVTYESELFTTGKWDDRIKSNPIESLGILVKRKPLKDGIKHLPVYHIPNRPKANATFGRSELAGIETLVVSIHQSFTDEELSLAVAGLGFFMTDGGPPRNEAGVIIDWEIGPLRVVEVGKGDKFERVTGVSSVEPSQLHIEFAQKAIGQTIGVPELAVGDVDTAVAESGISLAFKMSPMLAGNKQAEEFEASVLDQLWHDLLHAWFPAYESEQVVPDGVEMVTVFGDPMPVDVAAEFERINTLYTVAKVMSAATYIKMVNKLCGYEIPEDDFEKALDEQKKSAEASDPLGMRMADEQAKANDEEAGAAAKPGVPATNGKVPANAK